jgi:hypothetical protein
VGKPTGLLGFDEGLELGDLLLGEGRVLLVGLLRGIARLSLLRAGQREVDGLVEGALGSVAPDDAFAGFLAALDDGLAGWRSRSRP